MFGGARNGYCSTERPRRTTTPSRTVRIEMTMATMGRPMKKFATRQLPSIAPGRRAGRGLHQTSGLDLLHPLDDDALPGFDPFEHDEVAARLVADGDGADRKSTRLNSSH